MNKIVAVKNIVIKFTKTEGIFNDIEPQNIFNDIQKVCIKNNENISLRSHMLCLDHEKKNLKFYLILNNENITKRKNSLVKFLDSFKTKYKVDIYGETYSKIVLIDYLKKDLNENYQLLNVAEFENPK